MNKLNSHPPQPYQTNAESVASTFSPVSVNNTLGTTRRLLVLIPTNIDYSTATRRIWELANAANMDVQLLGLCKEVDEGPALRRALISIASLLQDGSVCTEVRVDIGTNWMAVVTTNYRPGDAIVCFADQRTGLLHRPLSQVLESNFKATVYILSNLAPQKATSNTVSQIVAWVGFIGIIIGFGMLQANIIQLPKGWLQSILLTLSILPEFWLIWVWNGHFR